MEKLKNMPLIGMRIIKSAVAVFICYLLCSLPKEKREDLLFISGADGILLNRQGGLSDYCKVELNRMIDRGAKFTIATMRTPASLLEPLRGVRLNLPVIIMDGAALYHIGEKEYRKVYVISSSKSREIRNLVKEAGLKCCCIR